MTSGCWQSLGTGQSCNSLVQTSNVALTIAKTLSDISNGSVDEVILVDGAGSDNTVEIAESLGTTA